MKKLLLTLSLIGIVAVAGISQKAIFKVNLYTFIKYSDPEVYLEINLNDKTSIDAALRLGFNSSPFSNQIHANVDLRAGYRYYPLHKIFEVPIGLFLRPVAGFTSLYGGGISSTGNNRQTSFQLGGTGGVQYVFKKKFAIDLFYGQAYHFSLNDNFSSEFQPIYNIGVGYGF
ncbi:MAG TPA: hypothetical protein VKZ54_10400 [Membranihabitans sp.]|nr:hypothetical protein [Membranihabitans sp.]